MFKENIFFQDTCTVFSEIKHYVIVNDVEWFTTT